MEFPRGSVRCGRVAQVTHRENGRQMLVGWWRS